MPFAAGQREDLVDRIRGLIRDYTLGPGLLKEFIQNADDAGASHLRFTLDVRTWPASALPHPGLARCLGPALLIESDQEFSDRDFDAIQRIQSGNKRGNAGATGRFGLGFNVCYNVTDYPAFLSRDRLLLFDPHRDAVGGAAGNDPGCGWSLDELRANGRGWLRPFEADARDGAGALPGPRTVFRLPLRTAAQCGPDRIGRTEVSPALVLKVLRDAVAAPGPTLLFLKNVLALEVGFVDEDGGREVIADLRTVNQDEVRAARAAYLRGLDGEPAAVWDRLAAGEALAPGRVVHVIEDRARGWRERWMVQLGVDPDELTALRPAANALMALEEKPLPLVGAALCLDGPSAPGGPAADGDGSGTLADTEVPRSLGLSCGLPLEDAAHLPLQINAFVDLDSARRGPTWIEAAVGDAACRVAWNRQLLGGPAAAAAAALVDALVDHLLEGDPDGYAQIYAYLPRLNAERPAWAQAFAEATLAAVARIPVLPHRRGDDWVFNDVDESRLPPAGCGRIRGALIEDGLMLAEPPPPGWLLDGFRAVGAPLKCTTAQELAAWLRSHDLSGTWAVEEAPLESLRAEANIATLLGACAADPALGLVGLPLGVDWARRGRLLVKDGVLFASEQVRQLFPGNDHWFWAKAVTSQIKPARLGAREAELSEVLANLPNYIRHVSGGQPRVRDATPAGAHDGLTAAWLARLYRYFKEHAHRLEQNLTTLGLIPLIPDKTGLLLPAAGNDAPLTNVPNGIHAQFDVLTIPRACPPEGADTALTELGRAATAVIPSYTSAALLPRFERAIARVDLGRNEIIRAYGCVMAVLAAAPPPNGGARRIWLDDSGVAVALSGGGMHLPTGFTPPPGLVTVRLLHPELTNAPPVRAWAQREGAAPLTAGTYGEQLVTELHGRPEKVASARDWVLQELIPQLVQVSGGWSLQPKLRALPFGLDVSGRGCLASSLLDPADEHGVTLMGKLDRRPSELQRDGLQLSSLRWLGLRPSVQADNVRSVLEHGLSLPPTEREALAARICRYVEARVGSGQAGRGAAILDLPDDLPQQLLVLQQHDWVPVYQGWGARPSSSARFSRPRDCFGADWAKLVGGVAAIANLPDMRWEVRHALSLDARPDHALVARANADLRERSPSEKLGTAHTNALLDGRWCVQDTLEPGALSSLGLRVWDGEAWRASTDLVIEHDDLLKGILWSAPESWQGSPRRRTALALGVNERLDAGLAARVINERLGQSALHPSERLKLAISLWQDFSGEWAKGVVKLVPTASGHLKPLSSVLVDDAPWWRDAWFDGTVERLHAELPAGEAARLGCPLASKAVVVGLALTDGGVRKNEEAKEIEGKIRDKHLQRCFLRVLRERQSDAPWGSGGDARAQLLQLGDRLSKLQIEIRATVPAQLKFGGVVIGRCESDGEIIQRNGYPIVVLRERASEKAFIKLLVRWLGFPHLGNDSTLIDLWRAASQDERERLLTDEHIPELSLSSGLAGSGRREECVAPGAHTDAPEDGEQGGPAEDEFGEHVDIDGSDDDEAQRATDAPLVTASEAPDDAGAKPQARAGSAGAGRSYRHDGPGSGQAAVGADQQRVLKTVAVQEHWRRPPGPGEPGERLAHPQGGPPVGAASQPASRAVSSGDQRPQGPPSPFGSTTAKDSRNGGQHTVRSHVRSNPARAGSGGGGGFGSFADLPGFRGVASPSADPQTDDAPPPAREAPPKPKGRPAPPPLNIETERRKLGLALPDLARHELLRDAASRLKRPDNAVLEPGKADWADLILVEAGVRINLTLVVLAGAWADEPMVFTVKQHERLKMVGQRGAVLLVEHAGERVKRTFRVVRDPLAQVWAYTLHKNPPQKKTAAGLR
jgi:hypothetical protein